MSNHSAATAAGETSILVIRLMATPPAYQNFTCHITMTLHTSETWISEECEGKNDLPSQLESNHQAPMALLVHVPGDATRLILPGSLR